MALAISSKTNSDAGMAKSSQLSTTPSDAEASTIVEGAIERSALADIDIDIDMKAAAVLKAARKIPPKATVETDAKTPFEQPATTLGLVQRELLAVSETLPSTRCRVVMDGAPLKGQWSGYRLIAFQETAEGVAICMDSQYCVWNRDAFVTLELAETFLADAQSIPVGTVVLVATGDASCGDNGTGNEAIREALQALGAREFLDQFKPGN